MTQAVEFFTDRGGKVRWRVRCSRTRRVLYVSSRGFSGRYSAERNVQALTTALFMSAMNGGNK